MKTNKDREHQFRKDLQQLLDKHHAEITIGDHDDKWGIYSNVAIISMNSIYDNDDNLIEDFFEFKL